MVIEMATEDIMKRKAVVKLYLLKEMAPPWPGSPKTDGPLDGRSTQTKKPVASVLQEAEAMVRPSARGAAKKAQLAITQMMMNENMSPSLEDPEDPEFTDPREPHLPKLTRRNNAQTAVKKEDKHARLSEYELERLENIRRNRAFLTSINIQEAMDGLKEMTQRKRVLKRRSPVREPPRKSERLENIKECPPEPSADESYGPKEKVRGPILMNAVNLDEGTELPPELMKLFTENSIRDEKVNLDMADYQSTLKSMKLAGDGVARVVNSELLSAAFHPSTTSLLMAAGNHLGQVGLYNVGSGWGDDGVLLFEPHAGRVTCMAFSRTHPANLLSLASNGSVRCMDVERHVFDEVYETENTLRSFDFLSDDCSTLVVGHSHGGFAGLTIVDRRCGRSCLSQHALDGKTLRCVSVHPLHKHYIVVTESRVVNIYDSRCLGRSENKPVSQLLGHSGAIDSGYFSPSTGNRVLTSCQDNKIRVYDTTSMTSTSPLLSTIRIANNEKPQTKFTPRAVWDPKKEDCFAVGSLMWPRTMQAFHESGKRLHTFPESNKVLSVAAFHQSRNALLGGVASGHLFVFSD